MNKKMYLNKFISSLFEKNIKIAYLYFYIHFVLEVICFYTLSKIIGDSLIVWLVPFLYDAVAFVPQSIVGYINDKYPKINFSIVGLILLLSGFIAIMLNIFPTFYIPLIVLCLGNTCIHVRGAEITLTNSNGKLSHSAIFVAGGSFGVVTGKLLASFNISFIIIILFGLSAIPFMLLAELYNNPKSNCQKFDYHNKKINPALIVFLSVFIVAVRGYMGYGIPTSWNKTMFQTVLLFFMMGFGKAIGGILSDSFGMKKIAISSMILSTPFLLLGNNNMIVSLIGIFFFSMTMSTTLGLLVSVLKNTPGLAFGLTTIGLFLGTLPVFFIKIISPTVNNIILIVFTLFCVLISMKIIKGDDGNG